MPDVKRFIKIGADGAQLPDDATEWGAILDTETNLMWALEVVEVQNWKKAKAAAAKCAASGFSGWRWPTRKEQLTLVDDTRFDPAIDTEYFPGCPSDWFWTSTPAARSPGDCAWGVAFYGGDALWYDHDCYGFVRAVRPGQ
jgi:hypothetical protein